MNGRSNQENDKKFSYRILDDKQPKNGLELTHLTSANPEGRLTVIAPP